MQAHMPGDRGLLLNATAMDPLISRRSNGLLPRPTYVMQTQQHPGREGLKVTIESADSDLQPVAVSITAFKQVQPAPQSDLGGTDPDLQAAALLRHRLHAGQPLLQALGRHADILQALQVLHQVPASAHHLLQAARGRCLCAVACLAQQQVASGPTWLGEQREMLVRLQWHGRTVRHTCGRVHRTSHSKLSLPPTSGTAGLSCSATGLPKTLRLPGHIAACQHVGLLAATHGRVPAPQCLQHRSQLPAAPLLCCLSCFLAVAGLTAHTVRPCTY